MLIRKGVREAHRSQIRGALESQSKGSGIIKYSWNMWSHSPKVYCQLGQFLYFHTDPQSTRLTCPSFPQRKGRLHGCFLLNEFGKKPRSSKSLHVSLTIKDTTVGASQGSGASWWAQSQLGEAKTPWQSFLLLSLSFKQRFFFFLLPLGKVHKNRCATWKLNRE